MKSSPTRSSILAPIPSERRTWKVFVDGQEVAASQVQLELDRPDKGIHRVVELGWIDDGRGNTYDGVRYWELGGGGVVIVPYALIAGRLYVGVVKQSRLFMGGDCWNVPRGFLQFGETHRQAAKREFKEEVGEECIESIGAIPSIFSKVIELPGMPINSNSGLIDTTLPEEGARFFAVEVISLNVFEEVETEFARGYQFRDGVLEIVPGGERVVACLFIPWKKAVVLKDGFTLMAIARLVSHLCSSGVIDILVRD